MSTLGASTGRRAPWGFVSAKDLVGPFAPDFIPEAAQQHPTETRKEILGQVLELICLLEVASCNTHHTSCMEVDQIYQMAAIASRIITIRQFPTHLFLPFWRKLRCGRSPLRSGPGQIAHCRSKRRHRRAWNRIAAMARWPVGHAVL